MNNYLFDNKKVKLFSTVFFSAKNSRFMTSAWRGGNGEIVFPRPFGVSLADRLKAKSRFVKEQAGAPTVPSAVSRGSN
jgi:hypothetical protein